MNNSNLMDFSMHILDIAMNSVAAGATLIKIYVSETEKFLGFRIEDNGRGMDEKTIELAQAPGFTTKITESGGHGIPCLKEVCAASGGSFEIKSRVGEGTVVAGTIAADAPKAPPLGDIAETIRILIAALKIDFIYTHRCGEKSFTFDTIEIKEKIGNVDFGLPAAAQWLKAYIEQSLLEIRQ